MEALLWQPQTLNVRTDPELKDQAQKIFESIGLDLSTAINLFLKQTVRANNLPFIDKPTDNVAESETQTIVWLRQRKNMDYRRF